MGDGLRLQELTNLPALSGWVNFYVIVGSSAGALIGLQFVVMTLIADLPLGQGSAQAGHAFGTPTIVHFGCVLLLAAILAAPWQGSDRVSLLWGGLGICGILYELIVVRRMRRQTAYRPEFEDWLFHALLPLLAYAILPASALATREHMREALFAVAAATLLLLFTGIHNAWDAVTYHVYVRNPRQHSQDRG
jgi:hypothetical protein